MQISGQNNITTQRNPQVQYNSSYNCGTAASANGAPTVPEPQVMPPQTEQAQVQQPQVVTQPTYPQGYYYPPNMTPPQIPTSGVNIQIFNPAVLPPNGTTNVNAPIYYPPYTVPTQPAQNPQPGAQVDPQTTGQSTQVQPAQTTEQEKTPDKKTEKRDIVVLTDDYIRNLENYLNSQDRKIRVIGAKEVYERLKEDDSRKDDKALNALINKMLQDPGEDIRFLALKALDNRIVTGDDYTINVLKKLQNSDKLFGQEAARASSILLKMSASTEKKEFNVDESQTNK